MSKREITLEDAIKEIDKAVKEVSSHPLMQSMPKDYIGITRIIQILAHEIRALKGKCKSESVCKPPLTVKFKRARKLSPTAPKKTTKNATRKRK